MEAAEKKLDGRAQDDSEPQCINERRKSQITFKLLKSGGVLMTEQVRHLRSGKPHPPSVIVQTILMMLFVLLHSPFFILKSLYQFGGFRKVGKSRRVRLFGTRGCG